MTSDRRPSTFLLPLLVLAPAAAAAVVAWAGGSAAGSAMAAGLVAVPAACVAAWRARRSSPRPPAAAMATSMDDRRAAAGPGDPGRGAGEARAGAGRATPSPVAARDRHALLGRLTGALAHDFNNVLGVSSNSLLLLRRLPTEEAHRLPLDALERAIDRGARLVRQVQRLDASPTSGASPAASDLRATVEDVAELLRTALGSRIALTVDLPADLPLVRAASGELAMALLEAALDARDAMPGGGALRMRSRVAADGRWVEVDAEVSEPGPAPDRAAHAGAPGDARVRLCLRLPVAAPTEPGAAPR